MGKKVNHFTVTVKGEEVMIKRCTGCGKDKALSDYSKGGALFGRQAKCKACNKEEYAAMKAAAIYEESLVTINIIESVLLDTKYSGHAQKDADWFIDLYWEFAMKVFEERLKQLNSLTLECS